MIGLFDSGIGGLTVLKEVARALPGVRLAYLGDTARTPYGNKSAEVISQYGVEAARFLVERGAKVIVVACNTVSAVGLEAIQRAYPSVPVFDVITPAVAAITQAKGSKAKGVGNRCIGVMGTRALVESGIYQRLLQKAGDFKVVAHAAPLLVPLVEEGWLTRPETKRIVKRYLTPFKQAQVDTLVLACTHYPLLKPVIRARVGRRLGIVDPAESTAHALTDWLAQHPEVAGVLPRGEGQFYLTDVTEHTRAIAERWLRRTITVEQVTLR